VKSFQRGGLPVFPKTCLLRNSKKCTIRPVVPSDAEKLLRLVRTVAGETDFLLFNPDEFQMSVEDLAKRIKAGDFALRLVAEIEGDIVGELTFRTGKWSRTKHAGELGVMVRKDAWSLGIGTALLESLISWAEKSRIRKINLRVRVDNEAAIRLYKKFGFQIEGTLSREIFVNGRFYDCYWMGLTLD
jgi:RimJ/RimL family protein N-acetyltransferase